MNVFDVCVANTSTPWAYMTVTALFTTLREKQCTISAPSKWSMDYGLKIQQTSQIGGRQMHTIDSVTISKILLKYF